MLLFVINPELRAFLLITHFVGVGLLIFLIALQLTMPDSSAFYLVFSSVEILLSLLIAWYAWQWPKAAPIPLDIGRHR